ncbi:MAG: ATP-binding cassette domain-containing protein [Pseudomonadota bacterium]
MAKPAPQTLLALADVHVHSGDRVLFNNTNWTYVRGQHWALIGRNGSGKTLLACAIAGQVPVAGEISYRFGGGTNEDAVSLVSFEQQRAVAGDAPAAMRWSSLEEDEAISVRQFLSQDAIEEINPFEITARSPASASAFERRRRRVLRLLAIEGLADRLLPTLSNGEMRKVLIARALLRRPRLLILDDPFTGLDRQFRAHLKCILTNLMRHRSVHLLLIATRPDELPRGITHVLLVDGCRVIAQGPRGALMKDHRIHALMGDGSHSRRASLPSVPAFIKRSGTDELVRLSRVCVRYDGHTILEDINWTIYRGESWALLGPNGSGKSTLLSLIVGDNPQAYANTVYLFGRRKGSGETVWDSRKRIGWVSPELHLHFPQSQTCLETVISGFHDRNGGYGAPTAAHQRIAVRWLDCFELADCLDTPFGSLSAGLQRMTLLARALVKSPDLLLLDEPCQGLDRDHRMLFVRTIDMLLKQTEVTVIFVSHRSDEIPLGIQRVLRLQGGRVDQSSRRVRRAA